MNRKASHLFASDDKIVRDEILLGSCSEAHTAMASIYVDISPSDQVLLRALGPNQLLLEFLNPYRPDGMPVSVNVRNDPNMPYTPIHYLHMVPQIHPQHPIGFDPAVAASFMNDPGQAHYAPYMFACEDVEAPAYNNNYETPFDMRYHEAAIESQNNQTEVSDETKESIESCHEKKMKKKRKHSKRRKNKNNASRVALVSAENSKRIKDNRTSEPTLKLNQEMVAGDEREDATSKASSEDKTCGISIDTRCAETSEENIDSRQMLYYPLIIRNVMLENPNDCSPNDLNLSCSWRLKSQIPILRTVSTRCIVMECSRNERGFYGTVKLDIGCAEVRDSLASHGCLNIDGRNCVVEKSGNRINAFRCFRCQTYREHGTKSCSAEREYCLKCSGSHRFKDCLVRDHKLFRCINCVRAGHGDVCHMAGTFYCPIEIEQRIAMKQQKARRQKQVRQSQKPSDRLHSMGTVTLSSDLKILALQGNSRQHRMFV